MPQSTPQIDRWRIDLGLALASGLIWIGCFIACATIAALLNEILGLVAVPRGVGPGGPGAGMLPDERLLAIGGLGGLIGGTFLTVLAHRWIRSRHGAQGESHETLADAAYRWVLTVATWLGLPLLVISTPAFLFGLGNFEWSELGLTAGLVLLLPLLILEWLAPRLGAFGLFGIAILTFFSARSLSSGRQEFDSDTFIILVACFPLPLLLLGGTLLATCRRTRRVAERRASH